MPTFISKKQSPTATAMVNNLGQVTYGGTDLGSTDGGATITANTETNFLSTDQLAGPIIAEVTNQTIEITMNLAETTVENLAFAMHHKQAEITSAVSSTTNNMEPDPCAIEQALVLHSHSATGDYSLLRTFTFPRAVVHGSTGSTYVKDSILFAPITFMLLLDKTTLQWGTIKDDNI